MKQQKIKNEEGFYRVTQRMAQGVTENDTKFLLGVVLRNLSEFL